jgi:phosphinothricin acetyltransferase
MELRLATEADAVAVQAIYAPIVETSAISFELVPPSPDEMGERIRALVPTYPWLVAEDGGEVLGYAYAGRLAVRAAYAWSVETSIYVAGKARGGGVGRALYSALFEVLVAQGFRRALAGIALPNPASVGFHEAMGFSSAGTYKAVGWKLGAWHDVGWWERGLLPLGDAPPAPALPLGALPRDVLEDALGRAARGALPGVVPPTG